MKAQPKKPIVLMDVDGVVAIRRGSSQAGADESTEVKP